MAKRLLQSTFALYYCVFHLLVHNRLFVFFTFFIDSLQLFLSLIDFLTDLPTLVLHVQISDDQLKSSNKFIPKREQA